TTRPAADAGTCVVAGGPPWYPIHLSSIPAHRKVRPAQRRRTEGARCVGAALDAPYPSMDYQLDLPVFRGPLDLLLYLVKRNEVDVCDIPIARVAEQFLDYLGVIQQIDVEWAGDFLVMAATL